MAEKKFKYNREARELVREMRRAKKSWEYISDYLGVGAATLIKYVNEDPAFERSQTPENIKKKQIPDEVKGIIELELAEGKSLAKIYDDHISFMSKSSFMKRVKEDPRLKRLVPKAHRPKIILDEEQLEIVYNQAAYGTPIDQIAYNIGKKPSWLRMQLKDEDSDISYAYNRGRAHGGSSINRMTFKQALKGDRALLMHYENTRQNIVPTTAAIIDQRIKAQIDSNQVSLENYHKVAKMSEDELLRAIQASEAIDVEPS